jgi:shikimate kinase
MIYLVGGPPRSGKPAVARHLATMLDFPSVRMDGDFSVTSSALPRC